MDNTKIVMLSNGLQTLSFYTANQPIPFDLVLAVREGMTSVAQQISSTNPAISNHLIDLKNALFTENPYQRFFIHPVVYGQALETIAFIKGQFFTENQADNGNLCRLLHPDILRVSEKLYRDGSYANAACDAFIEINVRLKELYRAAHPDSENIPDGQQLMNKVFAEKNPALEAGDRTTQTGRDIHDGTRFLFAGAMAAFRNPKSHENITLGKDDCLRRLIFASMLMFKIDEIVATLESK